jgi:hypothetical protein
MKSINIIIFLILICFSLGLYTKSENLEKIKSSNINPDLINSAKKMENILSSYLVNPQQFILSHSNKDNFIAIFSNFTRLNGEVLYNEYIESKHHKDIQFQLDDLNNFKFKNVMSWEFDNIRKNFVLPDEIRSYPDFYKWQMIISIMKTMQKIPAIRKDESLSLLRKNKNLRNGMSLVFPDEIKIIDPPKEE